MIWAFALALSLGNPLCSMFNAAKQNRSVGGHGIVYPDPVFKNAQ
jgi:hypothetical protein